MVLVGIEPMTMRWATWQEELKGKHTTTGPNALGCLVDHDTRGQGVGLFENLK